MNILILLFVAGAFVALIWFIFYKTLMWTIRPIIEHFEEKNKEQKEIHDNLMEIKKNTREK